jgi:acyl carrier protein
MALEDKVKEIIVNELGVDMAEVVPEASFINDLGADSLGTVELVLAFEKEFSIEIPEEDAEKMGSVGDAINYLKERLGQ